MDNLTKTISLDRSMIYSVGTRMWYVLLDTDGVFFQRWSALMDDTDEILFTAQSGDNLAVTYVQEPHNTGDSTKPSTVLKNRIVKIRRI